LKHYQVISSVENLLYFELIEYIRNLYKFDDVDPLDGIIQSPMTYDNIVGLGPVKKLCISSTLKN
jgi:hypothetical protein